MKTTYKGFLIYVERRHDIPDAPIEFNVTRKSDGQMIGTGFEYEDYNVKDFVKHLKGVVDDYIAVPDAYGDEFYQDDLPPDDYEEEIDGDADPLEAEENEGGVGQ